MATPLAIVEARRDGDLVGAGRVGRRPASGDLHLHRLADGRGRTGEVDVGVGVTDDVEAGDGERCIARTYGSSATGRPVEAGLVGQGHRGRRVGPPRQPGDRGRVRGGRR